MTRTRHLLVALALAAACGSEREAPAPKASAPPAPARDTTARQPAGDERLWLTWGGGEGEISASTTEAMLVERFGAGHVNPSARDVCDPEGDEVQIVVCVERQAVELDVPTNLQVLPRVEERPRGPRKTHPARVEICDTRAALVEDALDPRQTALARARVAVAHKALKLVVR
jgi:hypothetical protein